MIYGNREIIRRDHIDAVADTHDEVTVEIQAALEDLIRSDYDLQKVKTETLETLQKLRATMEEEAYKEHVERIEAEYDLESHVNDLQKLVPSVWDGQHDAVRERLRS